MTHTIDAGHRVLGHTNPDGTSGKCARLHGHTYRFDITIAGEHLDDTGFVVDFGVVKRLLDGWDHRLLLAANDPIFVKQQGHDESELALGVARVPFNPTAENMARAVAETLAKIDGVLFADVTVAETPKTTARWRESNR